MSSHQIATKTTKQTSPKLKTFDFSTTYIFLVIPPFLITYLSSTIISVIMQNHKSQPPMTPRSSSARGGRNAGISKSSTSNASGNNSDAVIPGPGRLRLTAARKQALIENVRLEGMLAELAIVSFLFYECFHGGGWGISWRTVLFCFNSI